MYKEQKRIEREETKDHGSVVSFRFLYVYGYTIVRVSESREIRRENAAEPMEFPRSRFRRPRAVITAGHEQGEPIDRARSVSDKTKDRDDPRCVVNPRRGSHCTAARYGNATSDENKRGERANADRSAVRPSE